MADVRALLAAERQSRRISHPHLTYSRTGTLNCNVCNLNIKSEQLWPGHLKSLNHRKNVQKISTEPVRPQKRKIDSVEVDEEEERNYEVDSRKKPKPVAPPEVEPLPSAREGVTILEDMPTQAPEPQDSTEHNISVPQEQTSTVSKPSEDIDENEWAAFEREVAPLAQASNQDYTAATIEAAPVSAAELSVQQKTNTLRYNEEEAEAEKEEESRRMEEEFEVMEEMEDRVKRLRARREALRTQAPLSKPQLRSTTDDGDTDDPIPQTDPIQDAVVTDEDDDGDDAWYG